MRVIERVATDPRISRRRAAVERIKRRRILLRASLAVAVVAAVWIAFFSPLLTVQEVRVTGARHTTSADVAAVAGLDSSDNLLLLSTSEVAKAAETLPWVKRAEVDRMLPGTVRVRVVERQPALVVSLATTRYTVDARGHVLALGKSDPGLVALAGFQAGPLEPGDRIDAPEALAALRVWRSLPRGLRKNVHALFAPTVERLTLVMNGDLIVRYGAAEQLPAKNRVVVALLARLRTQGRTAAYVDVRVPTSPAVAPVVPPPVLAPAPAPVATPSPSPSSSPTKERKTQAP